MEIIKISSIVVINYEVTTYTSTVSGSSPSSNPYIAIYGRKSCTKETPLVSNAADRGRYFKSGVSDKFLLEVTFDFTLKLTRDC